MEVVVTTGVIRCALCNTPVKSSPPTNQHPMFYRPDSLPVTQPPMSKHWREITIVNNIYSTPVTVKKRCSTVDIIHKYLLSKSTPSSLFNYSALQCAQLWGTSIRGLMRGMATLPQGNQKVLVVRDKVGRPPGELGVSKSMECDIFPSVLWRSWLGDRKGTSL